MEKIVNIDVTTNVRNVTITAEPNEYIVNINTQSGGGGSQTWSQTLDNGRNTGGFNPLINDDDAIDFQNGSYIARGTDEGTGGNGGIEQTCSIGYKWKWEAGEIYIRNQGNNIIRKENARFAPTINDDDSSGFIVDAFWEMYDGTLYKLLDATEGAADWEIYATNVPTLQQVTDEGNTTTNDVIVRNPDDALKQVVIHRPEAGDDTAYVLAQYDADNYISLGVNEFGSTIGTSDINGTSELSSLQLQIVTNDTFEMRLAGGKLILGSTIDQPYIGMSGVDGSVSINTDLLDGAYTQQLPPKDGTFAMLSDIAGGGGASISFYLNGSVSQGTFGGVAFREMDRTPILGAGTDFTINANGYIQSFITDAGVPNLLEIPAGNWNFETYFSASSGGGSPSFYVELYKWDGTTLSLIASNSANPEFITGGTNTDLYVSALAVPQTTLLATDRLAVRIWVNNSGRTITLHTEDNNLCQIITTFSTGLTALNGLTAQVQNFATGTSGTDFGIVSSSSTHTFNLPNASAANRGLLTSSDWSAFNSKLSDAAFQFTRRLIANGTGSVTGTTAETIITSLTIPANTLDTKCFIWTTMDYFKTNAGNCTLRLYVNSSNSLSGATQIGFATIGSNRNLSFNRKLYLNGTTLDFLLSTTTTTQSNNEFGEAIFGASTTTTVNPANDIFLIYTTTNDAVGPVTTAKQATVQKLKLN